VPIEDFSVPVTLSNAKKQMLSLFVFHSVAARGSQPKRLMRKVQNSKMLKDSALVLKDVSLFFFAAAV
jgi:hypothetical protein